MQRLVHRTLLAATAALSLAFAMPALAQKVKLATSAGDIVVRKGNFTLYAPIMTGIILSLVLTLVLNLWARRH